MATIKSYSDLEQSKKLAEILPLDSADMNYTLEDFVDEDTGDVFSIEKVSVGQPSDTEIGCWSLSALLGVLQDFVLTKYVYHKGDDIWVKYMCKNETPELFTAMYDNPVDACVAMIEKLNELNLL